MQPPPGPSHREWWKPWSALCAKSGPTPGVPGIAGVEIEALSARFPDALVRVSPETVASVSLPDPDDAHVLAAAIDGGVHELLTLNIRDFPTIALAAHGIDLVLPIDLPLAIVAAAFIAKRAQGPSPA